MNNLLMQDEKKVFELTAPASSSNSYTARITQVFQKELKKHVILSKTLQNKAIKTLSREQQNLNILLKEKISSAEKKYQAFHAKPV